jgi:ABC-2 type transport system ATP-binding protein
MTLALDLKDLTKQYNKQKKPALKNVSLAIQQGKVFSILGPNGAGKTTLIKLIIGIIYPTSGSGSILGLPIGSLASKKIVGYVPEQLRFPAMLTGQQTLKLFGHLSELHGRQLEKRIDSALEHVQMTEHRHALISSYSKGMLQRIGIAQALLTDPKILFLDEPTDGIDPLGRIEIKRIIRSLNEQGTTIIINSHILTEVEQITDEYAILQSGMLIKQGAIKDISHGTAHYMIIVEKQPNTEGLHIEKVLASCRDSFSLHYDPSNILHNDQTTFSFKAECTSTIHLNTLIDTLRSHNITICAIEPQHLDLESIFMTSLTQQNTFLAPNIDSRS